MSINFVKSKVDFDDYLSHNKYLVANFTAQWCGPCQTIKPVVDQLYTDLNKRYHKIEIIRVDLDTQPDLAAKYEVTSIPTFVFFESGKVVETVKGASFPNLVKALDGLEAKALVDDSVQGRNGNGAGEVIDFFGVSKLIPKGFEILNRAIDFGQFEALNVVSLHGVEIKNVFAAGSDKNSSVASDADSQGLFYVPLNNICKVYSILIKARKGAELTGVNDSIDLEESQVPNLIKVWVNGHNILSFDEANDDKNPPHLEKISEDDFNVWYECKLKFVRFQKVQSLIIFFDGEDEDDHTLIEKILLVGLNGDAKDQGTLAKDD